MRRLMEQLAAQARVDVRNMGRDSMLMWLPMAPLFLALVLRLGVPQLSGWLQSRFAFSLEPYYPLIGSFYVLMASSMAGMISGFLLLDERDEGLFQALMVTPIPFGPFMVIRAMQPAALGLILTLIGYPIVAPLQPMPILALVLIVALSSLISPMIALFLVAFAENKVAGLAVLKMSNTLTMLPVAAYFIDSPWQLVLGVIPTYWPMKAYWVVAAGDAPWGYLLAGSLVGAAAVALFLHRFRKVLHAGR